MLERICSRTAPPTAPSGASVATEVDRLNLPAAVAFCASPAELEGEQDDQRQHDHEAERQLGTPPAGLAAQLGAEGEGTGRPVPGRRSIHCGQCSHHRSPLAFVSPPTSARNASSSRRLGTTRSTPTPACTSAATASARDVPSRSTTRVPVPVAERPSSLTPRTPARSRAAVAATASETSNCTDGESPTMSSTGPAATTSPLCSTTTWVP